MTRESDGKFIKRKPPSPIKRRARGFVQTGGLLGKRIRGATAKRGFAETRLLTHWADIVGPALADIARPVKVSHSRDGFGATLTVLSDGARAPELQMMLPNLKEKINALYGYSAISRIRITQTAGHGFAEPANSFAHKPAVQTLPKEKTEALQTSLSPIADDGFRAALELLGKNVLIKNETPRKEPR